jgi:ATP-binding cassette subfamily F protein uup
MLQPADLLLLDEPTNDLDLQSLEVLETSMREFSGALVLVTHDRYLLDRVSRRLLALDGKGNARMFADLSQWEAWRQRQVEDPPAAAPCAAAAPARGLSGQELKELKTMEARIHDAEARAEAARLALEDPSVATDAVELLKRHEALDAAQARISALFSRWEELEAKRG